MAIVAEALGIPAQSQPEAVIAAVEQVLLTAGVPTRMRNIGAPRDLIDDIADHTVDDWSITRVPRQCASAVSATC